jgi:pimeloyl-ACP methyl ester carboxylesterase
MPYVALISPEAAKVRAKQQLMALNRSKTLVIFDWRRDSIIYYLKQLSYKKFILWGRSMGATSLLLYSLKYKPQDVILQIIDSPFYSFYTIAL